MGQAPDQGQVLYQLKDGVATATLSRPGRKNALSIAMLEELRGIVDRLGGWSFLPSAPDSPPVRVLVLRGEGGVFAAGADLRHLATLDAAGGRAFVTAGQELLRRIEALPVPVLAAVEGPALGGGCELALACDLICACETALFALPEVERGFIPGWGGTVRLPRRVGLGRAKELILTGRAVEGREALAIGLAERLYPAASFAEEVEKLARDLAAKAPVALALAKSTIRRGADAPLETALALEREAFSTVFSTEDAREGVRSFLEKRPPRFSGK